MCDYKIEDLRGKYVKVGTPEYEVFVDACDSLGISWDEGVDSVREGHNCLFEVLFIRDDLIPDAAREFSFDFNDQSFSKFAPKPKWSPETNALPLKDLSDEQRGMVVGKWASGCVRQALLGDGDTWRDIYQLDCTWHPSLVYRIKKSSEREVFIADICVAVPGLSDTLAGEVFDAIKNGDIKAPEVEQ